MMDVDLWPYATLNADAVRSRITHVELNVAAVQVQAAPGDQSGAAAKTVAGTAAAEPAAAQA